MKGIRDFINNIKANAPGEVSASWDPGQDIGKAIDRNLAMLAAANIDWSTLIANGESLGKTFEQEPDRARDQEKQLLDEMNRRR